MAKAGKEQRYLVDPNTSYAQVVQERDENGLLQARYLWEESLAPLVQFRRTASGGYAAFFYLCDGQDSVRQLTDAAGSVTDSYYYDAFGNALPGGTGTTPNPFRYTGQQDDGGGRYFLRARYYSTGTGRFLNQDPFLGSNRDPNTLHRYRYGACDPANQRDPSGKSEIGELTLVTSAIIRNLGSQIYTAFTAGEPAPGWSAGFYGAYAAYLATGSYVTLGVGSQIAQGLNEIASAEMGDISSGLQNYPRTANRGWEESLPQGYSSHSRLLRARLKSAGIDAPGWENAAHHIMPWDWANKPSLNPETASKMLRAYQHLDDLGIQCDDPANGVFLRSGVVQWFQDAATGANHDSIHTVKYGEYVADQVLQSTTTEEAVLSLRRIAGELLMGKKVW